MKHQPNQWHSLILLYILIKIDTFKLHFTQNPLIHTTSGKARGHACHVVHDQSFSELTTLFMNFHGQSVHKTKSFVL